MGAIIFTHEQLVRMGFKDEPNIAHGTMYIKKNIVYISCCNELFVDNHFIGANKDKNELLKLFSDE